MNIDDLLGFLPMLIFILAIVIDKSQRRKRRRERGHFPPLPDVEETRQSGGADNYSAAESSDGTNVYKETPAAKNEEKPWYVEFPEDREQKQRARVYEETKPQKDYRVYNEPVFIKPEAVKVKTTVPVFAVPQRSTKKPLFTGKISRQRLRDGVIMAEILDKPRALKPYREPY